MTQCTERGRGQDKVPTISTQLYKPAKEIWIWINPELILANPELKEWNLSIYIYRKIKYE